MTIPITMPALSPTMEEGNLAKWHVKVGDKVKPGDVIAEIETDKATMEVEAVDEGVVSKLLVEEGAQGVKVNAVIAELSGEGEAPAKGNGGGAKAAPAKAALVEAKTSPRVPRESGGPRDKAPAVSAAPHPRLRGGRGTMDQLLLPQPGAHQGVAFGKAAGEGGGRRSSGAQGLGAAWADRQERCAEGAAKCTEWGFGRCAADCRAGARRSDRPDRAGVPG